MFLKELFSDSGKVSFGRVSSSIALICSCCWVSYVVYKTVAIPELGGVALFIGTLYALSKAGETVKAIKGSNGGTDAGQG